MASVPSHPPGTCQAPAAEGAPWQPGLTRGHQGRPGAQDTHLAAAEDVCVGDTHVEVPEHSLGLLLGLEGAVHPEAAPSPDLRPELRRDAALSPEPPRPPPPPALGPRTTPWSAQDAALPGEPTALRPTVEPELGVLGGGVQAVLTWWYGSPEVRMVLPSCRATCGGGKVTSEGHTTAWGWAAFVPREVSAWDQSGQQSCSVSPGYCLVLQTCS